LKSEVGYLDDSAFNLECIELVLRDDFNVIPFTQPELFLGSLLSHSYSAILLDVNMPIMDGFEVFEKILQHPSYNGCPILFLSSDLSAENRIKSFTLGAVDYMGRDISPEEMLLRVKSKIQFFKKHRSIIEFGPLKVNLTLLKAQLNGQDVPLTFIELKILCKVLRAYPEPVPRDMLIDNVWRGAHVLDATIHTHVFNLNSKLASFDHEIQMYRNVGIQLVPREEKA
jgi:DNA-binding response OmpR family regulator